MRNDTYITQTERYQVHPLFKAGLSLIEISLHLEGYQSTIQG
ncbi:MAG: hypothetical protein QGH37_24985 [Candidatus Poribacteria bacterium]|nr:hypothetical protein [Candidatus Poribacteria bacterium]